MNEATQNTDMPETEAPAPEVLLSWVSHPLKGSSTKAGIAVGSVAVSIIAGGWYMESAVFGLIAGLVMFASLAKFFLPTTYTFNKEGVTIKTMTQSLTRPWSMFRSFYTDKNGVLLSPFIGPSRLENFRGLYMTFSANREAVLQIISERVITPDVLGHDGDSSDSSPDGGSEK